jgi:8-oxo-dGTP pyrophosphatase MutT (NUDIX family)
MRAPDLRERLMAAAGEDAPPSSDFDLNPGYRPPEGRVLREAGVLIGVMAGEVPRVLLTKRASGLKHHPGQIAFPGGKVDPGDGGPVGAALREAEEEIGLPRGVVEVLGTLPPHETVTGYVVTPVLGWISDPFEPVPEAGEVAEVFAVPFTHVAAPDRYVIESRIWRGMRRHYYAVPWGPYYIWGATARMLRMLAEAAEPG